MSEQYSTTANIRSEEIVIRAMEHTDLAVIVALDALVFGSRQEAYFERRLAVLDAGNIDKRAIFLLAQYRDRVIGFVMGTLAYGELGLTQVTSILDTIAVHPHYQQQGIGRQMIETFIKQSLAQGGPAVYMLVNGDNWSLLKVFHSLGFVLTPMILLERQID